MFHPDDEWIHFVCPVTNAERLWEGDVVAPTGIDVTDLVEWIQSRTHTRIALLGCELPSLIHASLPAPIDGELSAALADQLDATRRRKDDTEIALMRRAVAATHAGHAAAQEFIRPGVTERAIQIVVESAMCQQGADGTGYGTTVGAGTNAAVLHSKPGSRVVGDDDLVLIDAGGIIGGYTADVTRIYAAHEHLTKRQQSIYDIVLAAEEEGIRACKVGAEWHDVHRAAAHVLAQGLIGLGLLRGTADAALETEAIALFFPHGIGHMVGLGVRDAGGRALGREAGRRSCGVAVRCDFALEENFIMSVEPGLYFVPAILDDSERRHRHRDIVNWDAVTPWREVGGVRIEDNVLVTANGPDNLTAAIPK